MTRGEDGKEACEVFDLGVGGCVTLSAEETGWTQRKAVGKTM